MGCPGDKELIEYAKEQFKNIYGVDIFIAMEGARDRDSLKWPQIPILALPTYASSHSVLMQWLVPDATYYGGVFNNPLNNSQIDEILSIGYQPIVSNSLGTDAINHDTLITLWKDWMCNGYDNHFDRWQSYGQSIPECIMPQEPSYCP